MAEKLDSFRRLGSSVGDFFSFRFDSNPVLLTKEVFFFYPLFLMLSS